MKKNFKKIIFSTLLACGFLFTVSSCGNETKYRDGDICGEATPEGTNAYSQIRRFYVEQFVYEYNLTLVDGESALYPELKEDYSKKLALNEAGTALEVVEPGTDAYTQAHYAFYYYTNETQNLLETYAATTANSTNYLKLIGDCANHEKYGYFSKLSNMDLDKDKGATGLEKASVADRMTGHSKACLVFHEGFVDPTTGVAVGKTTWKQAWDVGLLYGLFVYPLSWLINLFVVWFGSTGWAQVGAILIVTILLKLLILLVTFKSQSSTQKMQDIQPELLKIQAKYGQNPSPEDRQRMSMEMMNIYQKYGVKPFAPFLSMLITFPVFIAMYRAVMFLGILRTGDIGGVILGNNLNTYIIGENAFNFVALIIFILMATSQIMSMKLPQIMNKKRMSEEAKKAQKQTSTMTNVMMIMILVMGFMMPVTMSVYWIASAVVGMIQSVIMHKLNNGNKKGGKFKMKRAASEPTKIPQGYKK